ncbi:hypothetical protein M102_gp37 [Streptococcus phage M102]|uniref:hypothetical protein n=1 Tax=Streptococcus phage M102 TaxID=372457 RepID=UPI00015968E1|nr:hypothetical protein M102_gp37 [Streptococcus phage M102]CAO77387.1 hypothetical protein [Streptococcus phage M102]
MIRVDRKIEDPFGRNILPEFVGKWLEEARKGNSCLTHELDCAPMKIHNWLMIPGNTERLMRAWLFDYEATAEIRYFVRIPRLEADVLKFNEKTNRWFFENAKSAEYVREIHTREQLTKAGFDWVFERKYAQEVI